MTSCLMKPLQRECPTVTEGKDRNGLAPCAAMGKAAAD
jgi:hypothetical protein